MGKGETGQRVFMWPCLIDYCSLSLWLLLYGLPGVSDTPSQSSHSYWSPLGSPLGSVLQMLLLPVEDVCKVKAES